MRAVEPPKTFPELIATGEKLKAKGVIPLALGGQPTWEHNLFRAVLVGHGGADMFRQVYGDRNPDAVEGPEVQARPSSSSARCAASSIRAARAATGTTPPPW